MQIIVASGHTLHSFKKEIGHIASQVGEEYLKGIMRMCNKNKHGQSVISEHNKI